jgi:aryl-alcohol dehydrogenase-like predicted oxidoreductase
MTAQTFHAIDGLRAAATERGVDIGALALAWVLSNPAVTSALIGPRRVEHFRPWLEAVDIHLTEGERDALVLQMETAAA